MHKFPKKVLAKGKAFSKRVIASNRFTSQEWDEFESGLAAFKEEIK